MYERSFVHQEYKSNAKQNSDQWIFQFVVRHGKKYPQIQIKSSLADLQQICVGVLCSKVYLKLKKGSFTLD